LLLGYTGATCQEDFFYERKTDAKPSQAKLKSSECGVEEFYEAVLLSSTSGTALLDVNESGQ
jgi:hypothetical protein